ncbi:hypothetical protein CVT26_002885 [Gymnopilus dilepis]|uniref:B30.2/SPRY domain-containing protein n=1 Tax=Gymnopilus dilepis TaxID=231916 RepID=A0A409W2C7_9AGAR|nr:hypothetical protein CVT26_002885 [Gymnopilus dilepis]
MSTASTNLSVSPTRSAPRSASLVSSVPGRTPSVSSFEPRVVRGTPSENSQMDVECQSQPATSPSSSRRGRGFPAAYRASAHDEESIGSPPPQNRPASTPLPPQDQAFKLPTRWSEECRHQHLSVTPDGRELSYQGPASTSDKDAAAARANHPIPPACGIYYYEVEIIAKEPKAFAANNVKLSRLTGWDSNSWGYHGEDGHALAADKTGSQYGPAFGSGDIVGCGIDFTTFKAFYTKNGAFLGEYRPLHSFGVFIEFCVCTGHVFDNVGKSGEIYPSVGLQHVTDTIRTNFGQSPFKFDIDDHVQRQSIATWDKILNTPLDHTLLRGYPRRTGAGSIASITHDTGIKAPATDEETKNLLNQLVLSYLVHHGYAKTARAFESQRIEKGSSAVDSASRDLDIEMNRSDPVEHDIELRTRIVNSVLAGEIDTAINALQGNYPSVLEADNHLILFKMRCRKFVELILETAEIKKKLKALQTEEAEQHFFEDSVSNTPPEEMDMDVDEDGLMPPAPPLISNGFGSAIRRETRSTEDLASQYELALNAAIAYGQALSNDYQSDSRPEVQQLFKQTFGIVAWEDPLEVGGPISELAGHSARVSLAHELNLAILKSQGRPSQPALETLYRHTDACIKQLGLLGVGAAAFADLSREFLQCE